MQAAAAGVRRPLTRPSSAARLAGLLAPCRPADAADAADAELHLHLLRHGLSASSPCLGTRSACGSIPLSTIMTQWRRENAVRSSIASAYFSTEARDSSPPTEVAQELYQKMLKSVEARTMPPNAWLWSMISSCSNKEDIKLLFQILKKLRVFRLSNLRIHSNFNCHLCMRVAEACARAGALDYGLKALCKHNVYGLTPTIGSAHYLLLHAKEHNDAKLLVKVMQALPNNFLPLQPGTADIVFCICYNTHRWDLLSKYASKFVKAGVKLHRTAFDIWMEFAAKVGDSQAIWNIETLRAKSVKQHTLASGFACAKGFLLECKPESAAATIHLLHQNLPDGKKALVKDELQKLIAEWPVDVIKCQKKEDRKAMESHLRADIATMVSCIISLGLDLAVSLDKLGPQAA